MSTPRATLWPELGGRISARGGVRYPPVETQPAKAGEMQRRGPGSSPAGKAGGKVGATGLLALAVAHHRGGRLGEAAALYRKIPARDAGYPDALHLLGLIEHASGRHLQALALIERAIGLRDGIAAYHVARSVVLSALDRAGEAEAAAGRALVLAPEDAEALNALGIARMRQGDAEAAAGCHRRALAARPAFAEAANNLGVAFRGQARLGEAEAALREAIRLRPGYASAHANLGLVLQDLGRYAEALTSFDEAVAADAAHPAAHGNRAMLLLLLGRLEEGFAEYEWRWRMPGFATPRRDFPQPEWDGGLLPGGTVLVHAEQGLGSAIQFVRYAQAVAERCGRLVLECQPPLARLFRQSLAAPEGPVAEVIVKGEPLPGFDRHVPLMSLPYRLGTTATSIPAAVPYLRAAADDIERWSRRLRDPACVAGAPPLRVGLVWAGNRQHENDANRSMPPAALAPLLGCPGARFFSLQVPADPAGLDVMGDRVTDLAGQLSDFADTAALMQSLDLVISVDTAAAHLAGALGRPAWVLLPYIPEWRWQLDRADSPWYPTVRLFRQQAPGDWHGVVRSVAAALAASVAERAG